MLARRCLAMANPRPPAAPRPRARVPPQAPPPPRMLRMHARTPHARTRARRAARRAAPQASELLQGCAASTNSGAKDLLQSHDQQMQLLQRVRI